MEFPFSTDGVSTVSYTHLDLNAKFSLEVSPGAVLEISYIGYQTQEVKVGDRTSLSVTLAENQQDVYKRQVIHMAYLMLVKHCLPY